MSIYICPACQSEYDEDYGFCHKCGARLAEKEKNNPALSLGDANAISGGVSINQSKNITSHDTHYHTTTVLERVKSESELKLDATNQLRANSPLEVVIDVYDISGRHLWSHNESGTYSGNTLTVDWNLTTSAGSRLHTGVYLYRVQLSCEGSSYASKANKLIVLTHK